MHCRFTRRKALQGIFAGWGLLKNTRVSLSRPAPNSYQLGLFQADVTPPLGHALMGGGIAPAKEIKDRCRRMAL